MNADLVARDAIAHIERLDIKGGDVLTVRLRLTFSDRNHQEITKQLRAWLVERGLPNVQILVMDKDTKISALPPEQMRAHGWVRVGSSQPD